jgi:hypothetical protein
LGIFIAIRIEGLSAMKALNTCGTVLDALYILATNTMTTANLNICGTSYGLTSTAAPTFSADHGYTGNGSTQFLITGFAPSSAAGTYSQNSASLGVYVLTSRTVGQAYSEIGANNGSNASDIVPWYSDNNFYSDVNGNGQPRPLQQMLRACM